MATPKYKTSKATAASRKDSNRLKNDKMNINQRNNNQFSSDIKKYENIEIAVNVQGDEPMIEPESIDSAIKVLIEDEKNDIADILTVATIKFADLLPYRTTDFIFDTEKITSFEGKTGPYVLYTMVRIKSILDKLNIISIKERLRALF